MPRCQVYLAAVVAAVSAFAGCGGGEGPANGEPQPAAEQTGDPTAGRMVFLDAGCGRCHTLAAAGTSGTIGPNLDKHLMEAEHGGDLLEDIERQVRDGAGRMPGFEGRLSEQEIDDVVAFVAANADG